MNEGRNWKTVNQSVRKVDALSMATGRAEYVDDIHIRGMLHAKVLGSPHAHARIVHIDTSAAKALDGVHAVLTYKDVPRIPHTTAGQGYPEPSPYDCFVLDDKMRFVGDRVAAVAAETKAIAEKALSLIEVKYEVLEPIFDPEQSMNEGAPVIHDEEDALRIPDPSKNLAAEMGFTIGDLFAEAEEIVEDKYITHYAQHCPIEPHITVGYFDSQDRLVLRSSTQVPFHARRITAQALNIPVKRIRVIKPRIGGGFGTKQEVLLEPLVAALCMATHRPVKYEFTREEETAAGRTRHPMVIWFKMGCKKDGTVTDLDLDVISNTGFNGSHALTVACNTGSKCLPLYRADNVKFRARTVYTNLPSAGAYRGYGATQAAFPIECIVDRMAERLGMDPIEFRKKNHIREGETSPVFKMLGEGREGVAQTIKSCGLTRCLDLGAAEIGWYEKRGNPGTGRMRRGIGLAALMQGSSIPGIDMGAASLKMNEDGSFNLLMGATDLGTGSDTVLAQIAAEVLTVSEADMIVYSSDTDMTPFDVGAYASSTTYLSGMAVKKAAEHVKSQILAVAASMMGDESADGYRLDDGQVVTASGRKISFKEIALQSLYIQDQHQIMGHSSHITEASPPPFSAHFAEVLVDSETGKVTCTKYVAAVDCGTAINPKLAEGQTEGAVMNGISYALCEEIVFDDRGRPRNPNWVHYKIYTPEDAPELKTIIVPTYEPTGPFGAKSVSEIGINGPLPAIANAIYDAVGVRLTRAPFTPERVWRAIQAGS